MQTDDAVDDLQPRQLRTMQIIAGAILLGLAIFCANVVFVVQIRGQGRPLLPPRDPVITYVAVAMLALCAPLAFVIPQKSAQTALKQISSGKWRVPDLGNAPRPTTTLAKLVLVRQSTMIIGLALLEGPAFAACIAYMIEGQVLALVVVGVAALLMLSMFPTETRVRTWLERQAEQLADLQQQDE